MNIDDLARHVGRPAFMIVEEIVQKRGTGDDVLADLRGVAGQALKDGLGVLSWDLRFAVGWIMGKIDQERRDHGVLPRATIASVDPRPGQANAGVDPGSG